MEDEDFGFTLRDAKVLQKALTGPSTDSSESNAGHKVPENPRSTPKANGGLVDATEGGVATGPRLSGGGTPGFSKAAGSGSPSSSVARKALDVPNVVEYHFKVKPTTEDRNKQRNSVASLESNTPEESEMRKDRPSLSSSEEKKSLPQKLSKMSIGSNAVEAGNELPQTFHVKYLGSHDARGLWGIKHTRRPVDNMVSSARSLPAGTILPFIKLVVSELGVSLLPLGKKTLESGLSRSYSIDTISYGVQDLVYTRVFSMIVVRDVGNTRGISPFECHGFVCESKHHARQLTYALANAFQVYSQNVKAQGKAEETMSNIKKRFAIDLRSPEEIEADLTADSEA